MGGNYVFGPTKSHGAYYFRNDDGSSSDDGAVVLEIKYCFRVLKFVGSDFCCLGHGPDCGPCDGGSVSCCCGWTGSCY